MVKFENRVAQTKINRFIEKNSLIIFLNSKSTYFCKEEIKNFFYNEATKYLQEAYNLFQINRKEEINFLYKTLNVRSTKNKYIKKVGIDCITSGVNFKKLLFDNNVLPGVRHHQEKNLTRSDKRNNCKPSQPFKHHGNCTTNIINPFGQGNNLIIILQPSTFFVLKAISKEKKISILGAIYKNCYIDHNQISDLSTIIENDKIYHNLNSFFNNNSFVLTSLLSRSALIRCKFSALSENLYAKLNFCLLTLLTKKKAVYGRTHDKNLSRITLD